MNINKYNVRHDEHNGEFKKNTCIMHLKYCDAWIFRGHTKQDLWSKLLTNGNYKDHKTKLIVKGFAFCINKKKNGNSIKCAQIRIIQATYTHKVISTETSDPFMCKEIIPHK